MYMLCQLEAKNIPESLLEKIFKLGKDSQLFSYTLQAAPPGTNPPTTSNDSKNTLLGATLTNVEKNTEW